MKLAAGNRFRLQSDILGIEPFENKDRARSVSLPGGSVVEVMRYPVLIHQPMAIVKSGGRLTMVFGHDLRHRAERIGFEGVP